MELLEKIRGKVLSVFNSYCGAANLPPYLNHILDKYFPKIFAKM